MQVASDHLVQRTLEELKQSVLSDAHKIQHSSDMAQGDLPVLSQVAAMQELIRARVRRDPAQIEQWRKALGQVFLAFSTNRKVYHHIRYLDEGGRELVRVDSDGVNPPRTVPRDQLQNRRVRDYFAETMKLGPGQVYTSLVDIRGEAFTLSEACWRF